MCTLFADYFNSRQTVEECDLELRCFIQQSALHLNQLLSREGISLCYNRQNVDISTETLDELKICLLDVMAI